MIKYSAPKFKIGDKIIVDDFEKATISERGLFKKNGKTEWSYKLKDNILSGFWANEKRIKLR